MPYSLVALVLAAVSTARAATSAAEPPESTLEPATPAIAAAAATQTVLSPVSNVQGAAFNRFIQIWLENTVFSLALQLPHVNWTNITFRTIVLLLETPINSSLPPKASHLQTTGPQLTLQNLTIVLLLLVIILEWIMITSTLYLPTSLPLSIS
jgi:hypothetical protein